MALLHRILIRLGIAWLVLVVIGTLIGLPIAEKGQRLVVLGVGAVCTIPSVLAFALAWVVKPPAA